MNTSTQRSSSQSADHDISVLRRLNRLLDEALQQPIHKREAWLDSLAPEHADLRPTLKDMLAHARLETAEFLSEPVALEQVAPSSLSPPDAPLQHIGPYQLVKEIGVGGMGTVWLANRIDGALNRQVALKLPRYTWLANLGERMRRERDILAALEHPHIARLYDAGVTAEGRPYLALEYVQGQAIDIYCREQKLSIEDKLYLFLQIAQAVSHAHAHLIVHRDLKPSNILVSPDAQVHLLDFGVAKLLDESTVSSAADKAKLTLYAGHALTPDYASPEQIKGEITTVATDVYSLGVLLFELLSEKLPFKRPHGTPTELANAVSREVSPLASTFAAKNDDTRILKGDLDNILVKALKSDPKERYPSVEAFAADVKRFLGGETVSAHPDSLWYRCQKFVRRNFLALLTTCVVMLSLGLGSGVALWQAHLAQAEAARAAQVKRFIASIFTQAVPKEGVGGSPTASALLQAAAERVERELSAQPEIQAELAVIIAESFDALAEPRSGLAMLQRTLPKVQSALGAHHLDVARLKILLADAMAPDEKALAIINEAIPPLVKALPTSAEETVAAMKNKSFVLAKLNQAEASYESLLQGITVAEGYLGREHQLTILSIGLLSNTYGRFEDHPKQLQYATEAMRRAEHALSGKRPHNALSNVERWYADALRRNNRPADAVPILRRVLADQRQLDGKPTLRARNALLQLAVALQSAGQYGEALPLLRESVALELQQNPVEGDDRRAYGNALAEMLSRTGHIEESLAETERVTAVSLRVGHEIQATAVTRKLRLLRLHALLGDFDQAHSLATEAIQLSENEPAATKAATLWSQAYVSHLEGKAQTSLATLKELSTQFEIETLPLPLQADIATLYGLNQLAAGDVNAAGKSFEGCRALFSKAQVSPSVRSGDCLIGTSRVALLKGDAKQALSLLVPLAQSWASVNTSSAMYGEVLYWLSQAQRMSGSGQDATNNLRRAQQLLSTSKQKNLKELAVFASSH